MPRLHHTGRGRKAITHASSSHLHLLVLPLEIREHVYGYLVDDASSEALLDSLLVNRQFHREAKPFLFKRTLNFKGQCQLFAWLRRVGSDYLRYVGDIVFQLHDIRPDEIVGALGKRLRQSDKFKTRAPTSVSEDNPYHEACELEVKRIAQAFSLMPNVKRFSIVPCAGQDPRPSYRMLVSFSRILAHSFPYLHTLLCKETSLPIIFATNKPHLKRLQIPYHSTSSSAEVATVCARLNAKKLAFYGSSSLPASVPHRVIMADALRTVRSVHELTLYESDVELLPRDVAHEALVNTPDAIGKHMENLQVLKILVEYSVEVPRALATLSQLQKFLRFSQIRRLEMAEPLIFTLKPNLPPSIETYVIRLDRPSSSNVDLAERVDDLLGPFATFTDELKRPGGARLPKLKEVVIVFETDEDEEEIRELEELEHAFDLFDGTSVRLRWVIGDPDFSI